MEKVSLSSTTECRECLEQQFGEFFYLISGDMGRVRQLHNVFVLRLNKRKNEEILKARDTTIARRSDSRRRRLSVYIAFSSDVFHQSDSAVDSPKKCLLVVDAADENNFFEFIS